MLVGLEPIYFMLNTFYWFLILRHIALCNETLNIINSRLSRPLLKSPNNIMSAVVWHPVHPVRQTQFCRQSFQKYSKLHTVIVQLVPLRENHGKCYIVVCSASEGAVKFLCLWKHNMKQDFFLKHV